MQQAKPLWFQRIGQNGRRTRPTSGDWGKPDPLWLATRARRGDTYGRDEGRLRAGQPLSVSGGCIGRYRMPNWPSNSSTSAVSVVLIVSIACVRVLA